jgi:hypothetical protein
MIVSLQMTIAQYACRTAKCVKGLNSTLKIQKHRLQATSRIFRVETLVEILGQLESELRILVMSAFCLCYVARFHTASVVKNSRAKVVY